MRIINLLNLSFVKTISGKTAGAQVGEAVDISQDGSTVAFSSVVNGHVIVFGFDEIAQDWLKIGVSICVEDEAFGWDISLSGDGQFVAIGAPLNDHFGPQSGKGYVYENQEEWTLVGLEKYGTAAFDSCGTTVDLSSNKERWVMGCPKSDSAGKDKGQAAVYCSENPAFATDSPSMVPSLLPTNKPSMAPSKRPSRNPSEVPSKVPSKMPSIFPSKHPSATPNMMPTSKPSMNPSATHSNMPSMMPTSKSSTKPSGGPTKTPTVGPSKNPTKNPTQVPSRDNDFGGQDTVDGLSTQQPTSSTEGSSTNTILQLILGLISLLLTFLIGICVGGVNIFGSGCGYCGY